MTTTTSTASTIATCGRATLGLSQMLVKAIPADRFARHSAPGGVVVDSNHPCFVFGHLGLYADRICGLAGDDDAAAELAPPEGWADLFGIGQACQDDPDGSIYPDMDEVMTRFTTSYERAIAAVERATDDRLGEENPIEGMRQRMGLDTIAGALTFLLTSHAMMHLGQVSAWRRMEGLGSAM